MSDTTRPGPAAAETFRSTPRAPSPLSGNPLLAIFEVCSALVASTDSSEMLGQLVARIGEAMNVFSCDLQEHVPERDACIYVACWCADGLRQQDIDYIGHVSNLRDRPDIRLILEGDEPFEQHVDDPRISATDLKSLTSWGYKSSLDVPLKVGDRRVGVLGVQESAFVRRFTPSEHDLLGWLCELAALGVYNAGIMRRQQERGRHLGSLVDVSRALASIQDPNEVFATIAAAAATAFDAPRVTVYEKDTDGDMLTARGIYPPELNGKFYTLGVPRTLEDACIDPSILTDRPPLVENVSDPELDDVIRQDLIDNDEKTCVSVPIVHRGEALGVLLLLWTEEERLVTDDELALATGIAQQSAVALRRARLLGARGEGPGSYAPHTPLPEDVG